MRLMLPDQGTTQSYSIDSLVNLSPDIKDIREYQYRRTNEYKQISHYPEHPEPETSRLTGELLTRLYGKRVNSVIKELKSHGFCRILEDGTAVLSWRFRALTEDEFDLGLNPETNAGIFHTLESQLWEALPDSKGVKSYLNTLKNGTKNITRISKHEYWFRLGLLIVAVRFNEIPSPELISLLDHKLLMISQEKMRNYFHIVSTLGSDSAVWANKDTRKGQFFKTLENFLVYSWRPFDMEYCEMSVDVADTVGMITSGSLTVRFNGRGHPNVRYEKTPKRYQNVRFPNMAFTVSDAVLRASETQEKTSYLHLHIASRSSGNVNPRQNPLIHLFIKLLIESVGKIIDVIIPVVQREDAERNLRWRRFLDSSRLHAIEHGENLHKIIKDALKNLKNFYGISQISIYSEDRELAHMLRQFYNGDTEEPGYIILDEALSEQILLSRQIFVFTVREIPDARVLLYFSLPRTGKRPPNPESPDQYLIGTEFRSIVREEATALGVTDLRDFLYVMVTQCLTASPNATLENMRRHLDIRKKENDLRIRLGRRIMDRLSRFFDLLQNLGANLESGLAYMRGRRDNLTGLYNRQYFKTLLGESFSSSESELGLMFLDLDHFKIFNDAVSHEFGDKLLINLANRLLESASVKNMVPGRFGGDEFCCFISGISRKDFEKKSSKIWRDITENPFTVSFYFDERSEGEGMEINMISFLHRLMRPDIGSRQAFMTEFIERPGISPCEHVTDIWKFICRQQKKTIRGTVAGMVIVEELAVNMENKILFNHIFEEIDSEFKHIIRLFITLQLKNHTTGEIRKQVIGELGKKSTEREITQKISAGLAHSSEPRLRSIRSLFNLADSRTSLAKQNGRNCLFGIDGNQLC